MSNKHYYENVKNEEIKPKESPVTEESVEEDAHEESVKQVFGVVSDCEKLNVRKEPDLDATSLYIVDSETELMVDLDTSTDNWYHVYNSSGLDGYCVKSFIKIKQ